MTRRDKLPRRAFLQKRKEDKDEKKRQKDRETWRRRGEERGGGNGGGLTWIFLLRNRSVSWETQEMTRMSKFYLQLIAWLDLA